MKRRIRRVVNFFAFNLLFFALYLNFIHQDKPASNNIAEPAVQATASVKGTVPVTNPEKYTEPGKAAVQENSSSAGSNVSVN